jgi:hypothetical protein
MVKLHTYGLATPFETKFVLDGCLVIYLAEHDGPSDINRVCGHNMIAICPYKRALISVYPFNHATLDSQLNPITLLTIIPNNLFSIAS